MPSPFRTLVIAAALLPAILFLTAGCCAAQPVSKTPRMPDGKPNLNGIWQAMNTANWELEAHAARPGLVLELGAIGAAPGGPGVVEGGEIAYLPAAKEKRTANFEHRLAADRAGKCH